MSRLRLAAVAATASCALMLVGGAAPAAAQDPALTKTIAMTGTAKNGKKFTGTYKINRFVSEGDQVFAVGKLTGTLKGRQVTRRGLRIPVTGFGQEGVAQAAQAACQVLTLTLGPLDLNLLGLRVQLNRINLRITAIPGGGLLGDLLCSLTNALNPQGLAGSQLAAILNALLALVPTTAGTAAAPR